MPNPFTQLFGAKAEPTRPRFVAIAYPTDPLPVAVFPFNAENSNAIQGLLGNLDAGSIDRFIASNKSSALKLIGQPYAAYNPERPDPVVQVWSQNGPDDLSRMVVMRRKGKSLYLAQAQEGANFLVLHKGDPSCGKAASGLVMYTHQGQPTQFASVGPVFEGANFDLSREDLMEIRNHSLGNCTCGPTLAAKLGL